LAIAFPLLDGFPAPVPGVMSPEPQPASDAVNTIESAQRFLIKSSFSKSSAPVESKPKAMRAYMHSIEITHARAAGWDL
jgi:hypothetical protein